LQANEESQKPINRTNVSYSARNFIYDDIAEVQSSDQSGFLCFEKHDSIWPAGWRVCLPWLWLLVWLAGWLAGSWLPATFIFPDWHCCDKVMWQGIEIPSVKLRS
jgi:hypothetical protein